MTQNVYMQFDFTPAPLAFYKPEKVFVAYTYEEVKGIFNKLEHWIAKGYYAAGYISYEAAPAFRSYLSVHESPKFPLVWFGLFSSPVPAKTDQGNGSYTLSEWRFKDEYSTYQSGIEAIRSAIEEGNTYQVNYTTRLEASFAGDDFAFYNQLQRNQASSYSAYLNLGDHSILSASPELFFQKENTLLTTKPMKGTRPRGRTVEEDNLFRQELHASEKDRAENLMIVDLLRNDLGNIAESGSVKVPSLFDLEQYPTVHQMTSTIQAVISAETSFYNLFAALFPCGSITGAPKVRTMEYIKQLEQHPREVYCGAIGYITPERDAIFNVPIRTVLLDNKAGIAAYGSGGGITWDSTVQGEYEEIQTKARLLTEKRPDFQLLESMCLDNGKFPLQSFHVKRVMESAAYFNIELDRNTVVEHLRNLQLTYPIHIYKVRLLVAKDGTLSTEAHQITPMRKPLWVSLAKRAIDSSNPFLYHKTTYRAIYDEHMEEAKEDVFSVLLWNEDEYVTEFTIGNVVIESDGEWVTPPVQCGLLAGTYREFLLQEGTIKERSITKEEVRLSSSIYLINGVRGWLPVELV